MPEIPAGVNAHDAAGGEAALPHDPCACVLVYATFPSAEEARHVARLLVESRLAACLNIIPGMLSVYRWQGAIHQDAETVAVIKTRAALAGRVTGFVRICHSYVNPAVLVLPVAGGSADFLAWIRAETAEAT